MYKELSDYVNDWCQKKKIEYYEAVAKLVMYDEIDELTLRYNIEDTLIDSFIDKCYRLYLDMGSNDIGEIPRKLAEIWSFGGDESQEALEREIKLLVENNTIDGTEAIEALLWYLD